MLTIIYSGCEIDEIRHLIKRLTQETVQVHNGASGAAYADEMEWTVHEHKLECHKRIIYDKVDQTGISPEWYQQVAHLLADFIFDVLESRLLRNMIQAKVMDSYEQDRLSTYIQKYLDARTLGKRHYVVRKIEQYLREHQVLHIMGFIRFRLQSYLEDLQMIVENAREDVLLDQQYDDFISLLKFYVGAQETKRNAIHLFHQDGNEFIVLDEEYQPLDQQMEDETFTYDDMILNTILTASPETIYIHTTEPEIQVIRTIRHIFDKRAVLCT